MSHLLQFTSEIAPRERRLDLFRAGAVDYSVDAVGDPLDFAVSWRLLVLNELNIIESTVTPVRYHRSSAMIEQDGKDRISILYVVSGTIDGTIDDLPVEIGPGDAMVFDLLRTLDVTAHGPTQFRIVTAPRHLVEEILPNAHFDGRVAAHDKLRLAFDQVAYLLDHANTVREDGVIFYARAIRNLLMVAILPSYRSFDRNDPGAPLLRRIGDIIDGDLTGDYGPARIASILGVSAADISALLDRFGGLGSVIERRRLLAAYRRLCDPTAIAQIGIIAADCGFSSRAEFGRRFRAAFRCAPRDLRTQHGGQLPLWAGAYDVERNYGPLRA